MYHEIKRKAHPVFNAKSGCVMAQEFSRRPVTAGHLFEPRLVCVEFVMDKVALGQVFLRVVRYYHRLSSQLQSTYISYHISFA